MLAERWAVDLNQCPAPWPRLLGNPAIRQSASFGMQEGRCMRAVDLFLATALSSIAFASGSLPGIAQQVTGVPGSPGATITLDGKQLPPPDPTFGGEIKERASESTPWWAPRVVPPKGAPN